MRNIPFSPPDITDAEVAEVVDVLRSGWITTGPKTKELERQITARCDTKKAVCLNSQTACAEMTLRLLGIGPGDEVIVPAYTYTATASVVDHVGAKIVMIDCEPGCFTMAYDKVEAAITPNTKAIIPVDLFGIPCDYERLFAIVEEKKPLFTPSPNLLQQAIGRVVILADAAHSFGAIYHGKPIGSIADFSCFSFHAVKNLTTAEGGAVTWRPIPGVEDDWLYQQYMLLSLHGQTKDALAKTKLGAWEYNIVAPYFKCNMTDVHAAIGVAQMRRYDDILARRRATIERMDAAFTNLPLITVPHYTKDYSSTGHLYITRLEGRNSQERNAFIAALAKLGVATNVHYKPLPMHTAYSRMGFAIRDYPNAYAQFENEVSLPLHTCLSDEDVEYVIEKVIQVMRAHSVGGKGR